MKAILLVILCSLSLAQSSSLPIASWAGSTIGVDNVFYYPVDLYSDKCFISHYTATWISFNYTFSTSGVYHILGLGEYSLYLYDSSFNASDSCQNALFEFGIETYQTYYTPVIFDFYNFQANTAYVFVAVTDIGQDLAIAIYDNIATGTNVGSELIDSFELIQSGACSTVSQNVPYGRYTWTQATSGLFDIISGWAENYTDIIYASTIMLFAGNVTDAVLTKTKYAPCTNPDIINGYDESYRSSTLWGVQLTAGQTYTIVSATDSVNELSNYGFFLISSRIKPATYLAQGFIEPETVSPCSPSTTYYNNQSFVALSFPAPFYKVVYQVTYFYEHQYNNWNVMDDFASYVYTGNNLGSSTTAPSTCNGLLQEDYTYASSFDSAPGKNYTIVVSYDNFDDAGNGNAFLVFILSGSPFGNVNPKKNVVILP